jgi:pyruvate/2-oxoglutarate dehydrogenase complex dihydrolipoamide acyltransferase (E2) component
VAKVTMPQLGESVAEGTVGRWLKQPGDTVAKYEPLLEVITDKVNAEVPSPYAGVLKEILVEEGATVPNNAEIAVIETADEGGADAPAPVAMEAEAGPEPDGVVTVEPRNVEAATPDGAPAAAPAAEPVAATATTTAPAAGPAGSDERSVEETQRAAAMAAPAVPAAAPAAPANGTATPHGDPNARMTPAVRRLLREHGLEAAMIVGTGGGGRITREDVTDYVEAVRTGTAIGRQDPSAAPAGASTATPATPAAPSAPVPAARAAMAPAPAPAPAPSTPAPAVAPSIAFPDGGDEVLLPMTQMRKGIAAQMTRALQVPHAYVQMEIDATNLVKVREAAKKDYQAKEGGSLSFVPFVIKATVDALKKHPAFNAHWTDQGILAKRRINMGVAVAVDDGLLVPVVRDVDALSIAGLNRAITDVANRARANKLRIDDFGGGTFTIDNTGYLGTNLVMPIINVPEVAILTMEAITKRPVVKETPDGDVIAIRPIMNMVLAIDHRANDGAQAAAFLRDVKTWLEHVGPDVPIW